MLQLSGQGLSCLRGGYRIFSDVGFAVSSGEGMLVEGSNGAGKTTFIRALAGFIPFHAGVFGLQVDGADEFFCERVHLVAHADAIKPCLTVRDNLAFWADYMGGGNVEYGLSAFSMHEIADLPAAYLSIGQRRQLALSRLKLVDRPVWLLDEPGVSLDTSALSLLARMISSHLAGGGIVVASSHFDLGVRFAHTLSLQRGDITDGELK